MNEYLVTGRCNSLFESDVSRLSEDIRNVISESSFLILGGAGTIGQATAREIFRRDPKRLCVVDISENNLVELVRDLRSSVGYGSGEFSTFAIDCGSLEYEEFCRAQGDFDYVLNFSAMKHVRSERDPFTLMRLIRTNVINTISTARLAREAGAKKYFCVSTDKAANPVNMMGASKRIMELFMMRESESLTVSMARFANVAFSDGSLLHGFNQRLYKRQPISAPKDVRRYFVSQRESGELCLLSTLFGDNLDIFFPKLSQSLHLTHFSDIARSFLIDRGYEPFECESEQEARDRVDELSQTKKWPCYFFDSDTTGEKDFEEFFTENEDLDWSLFESIGVIKNQSNFNESDLAEFEYRCDELVKRGGWSKGDLLDLYAILLPDFAHAETGKYLDQRM